MIKIGVGGLVRNRSGQVLLVRHNYPSYWYNTWILPGGMLQPGETLKECARREIREETGLDVEIGEHLITFERIVCPGELCLHVVYIDFWAEIEGDDTLTPGDDVGEARWVDPEELPDLAAEIHEDARIILTAAGYQLQRAAPAEEQP